MPTCFATARAVRSWSPVIITTRSPSSFSARIAAAESSFTASVTPIAPMARPSAATRTTVLPSAWNCSTIERTPARFTPALDR